MSIKNFRIKNAVAFILFQLFISFSCISQELHGIFVLKANFETYYVNFEENSYRLFSLQENPTPGGTTGSVLKEAGSGTFTKTNKYITFYFDSVYQKIPLYAADSLVSSMYSGRDNKGKNFQLSLKFTITNYENNYLIIEGYNKQYFFQIKQEQLSFNFPDSIIVKNVWLSMMGYGKRSLPFLQQYNTFKYDYFVNDDRPEVTFIKNETWQMPVKNKLDKRGYRFQHNNYLSKADEKTINFLRELAGKNNRVQKVTFGWFE